MSAKNIILSNSEETKIKLDNMDLGNLNEELAYSLPSMATCAITKLALLDVQCAITCYDALASASLGAVQCYSNYKATKQYVEPTTADVVVPYIADAAMLFTLSRNLQLDVRGPAMLMLSIKNAMSVAATVYATDCVAKMVMDAVPEELKEEYLDPAFNFASNAINDVANTCYQSATDVSDYLAEEASLIIDYVGTINLREDD